MPGPLRIFISSTMRDLANERAEVRRRLGEMNFQPVGAEEMMPDGTGSLDRLALEIEASDLFVLILGESYGWIPKSGPLAEEGKSVTELELDIARSAGIPVLVFMKRLTADAAPSTDDARRRDAFRAAVGAWDGGWFRTEFDLARDLSEKVGHAVVEFITNRVRAGQLQERRAARPPQPPSSRPLPPAFSLPHDLVEATKDRSAFLFLGAGVSLEAGMPSAFAFVEAMIERVRKVAPEYAPGASGTLFNAVASDFESLLGAEDLRQLAGELVDPAYVAEPTAAHRVAGRLFDTVVTTNYDLLLERAMDGREVRVMDGEATAEDLAAPLQLIKLHGSIANPNGLVLTEADLASFEAGRPTLLAAFRDLLSSRPILSVGSSLRDPSIVRLLEQCRPHIRGWAVLHDPNRSEQLRLDRWNLQVIDGDANSVLTGLAEAVG
jgi:hypothetical protein